MATLSLGSGPAALALADESPAGSARDFRRIARSEHLTEIGQGTLRWFGLPMYRATLRSADGRYAWPIAQPLSLTLAYQHRFSRQQLIDITASEWTRLGLADAPTRSRWAAALEAIWSDVAEGDEISVLVTPSGASRFYGADRLLGRVEDPAFGPAYLAIWLDARSAVGRLRSQLIGTAAGARP